MSDVTVYTVGIVCLSACAPKDMPSDKVAEEVNAQRPTGIESPWASSDDATFSGGEPMPCACNGDPERLHWLLNC